jgi:hypothetical protein
MLNKLTIIGIIIGSVISMIGTASMATYLNSPNEIQEDSATNGVGNFDKINFNAPENSSQSLIVTGDSFDIKITTPDSSNDVDASFKDKASFSWTSKSAGWTVITIQNTGNSEITEEHKFELAPDPLFLPYAILVIIAGVIIIGFSAGFSAKKPKGF